MAKPFFSKRSGDHVVGNRITNRSGSWCVVSNSRSGIILERAVDDDGFHQAADRTGVSGHRRVTQMKLLAVATKAREPAPVLGLRLSTVFSTAYHRVLCKRRADPLRTMIRALCASLLLVAMSC